MNSTMTAPLEAGQSVAMEEVPDPQVPEKARRRTCTARYRADVLAEYEACGREAKGALLSREGLCRCARRVSRPARPEP